MENCVANLFINQDCPYGYDCPEMDCYDCIHAHMDRKEDEDG